LATRAVASGDATGVGSDAATVAADRGTGGGGDGGGEEIGGGVALARPAGASSGVLDSDDVARASAGGGQIGALGEVVTGAALCRSAVLRFNGGFDGVAAFD
jgi:hypothetical protein